MNIQLTSLSDEHDVGLHIIVSLTSATLFHLSDD